MRVIFAISSFVLPFLLLVFAFLLMKPKANLFDSFVDGAKSGLETVTSLIPTLVLVMVGVNMLFASGAVDILASLLNPLLAPLGVPKEMLPNIVLRPFSGSATTVVADKMFRDFGADSDISKTSSILMGCTDTIIYTVAVYFSSVKIKKTRYAITSSFIVFAFSIFVSIFASEFLL